MEPKIKIIFQFAVSVFFLFEIEGALLRVLSENSVHKNKKKAHI